MASLFEEMGGTYHLGADGMYYPNLELPEEEAPRYGKYGRMRHTYLRERKKAYCTSLLFEGKNDPIEPVTKQMANSQGVTKSRKGSNGLGLSHE